MKYEEKYVSWLAYPIFVIKMQKILCKLLENYWLIGFILTLESFIRIQFMTNFKK